MTEPRYQPIWVLVLELLPFVLAIVTVLFGTWFMPVFFYYPPWYEHVAGGLAVFGTFWLASRWFDD